MNKDSLLISVGGDATSDTLAAYFEAVKQWQEEYLRAVERVSNKD